MSAIVASCPKCGQAVPADAPVGLCPRCLVAGGFTGSQLGATTADESDSKATLHIVIPEDAALPGGAPRQFGKYQLLEEIARGGMGIVYKARHTGLDSIVAVKLIRSGVLATPTDVERFQREAKTAARLKHPNIVTIHDIGEENGQHYFSMDYVAGANLAELARTRPFSPKQAAEIVARVAEAIHYAHQQGVLHRDLKPANVILTPEQQPRVLDFGLARHSQEDSKLTQSGAPMGSPSYMPPEQAAGRTRETDERSDVYALGAMLYELVTGRPPFQAASVLETLKMVMETSAASPRLLNPNVPPDLETICLKCLEKEPGKRYPTAQAFAEELGRFQRDEPIKARPVSSPEKLWRWCRRKPALASSLSLILILLLIVIIGSPIAVFRINRERNQAQAARKNETQLRQQADRRAYASDMNLIQRALEMNDRERAWDLLNRHRPQSSSQIQNPKSEIQDPRGWEWRYLWSQGQSDAESVFCKRSGGASALSVSHDGAWLAVAAGGTGVSVRDRATRRVIARLPATGQMVRAAFSPTELLLAYSSVPGNGSTSTNYIVHIWDGASRQIVRTLPIGGLCYGVAFSSDGRTLVTSTQDTSWENPDGRITLWRVSDWKQLASYPASQAGPGVGTPFALAGDLSVAAHALKDNRVRVIDLATGQERWKPQKATDDYIWALALSPDGKILASGAGSVDSLIQLWDVATGQKLGRLEGHSAGIEQLLFFPDGKTLASASDDQTIRLWDVTDPGKGRALSTLRGHRSSANVLALLPDNTTLVSGAGDGSVCLWNTLAKPRDRKRLTLPIQAGPWRFAPDSKSLVVLEVDQDPAVVVARWQGIDFQDRQQLLDLGTNANDLCFSGDARWLAVSHAGGDVEVWDLQSRSQSCEFKAHAKSVLLREFMAEGKKLMILHREDNSMHEWNLETRQETRSWPGRPGRYTGAFSPDGNWYLTSILNPDAKLVTALTELNTGREINLNFGWYVGASFSSDSKLFALAGWSRDVRLLETATRNEVAMFSGFSFAVWGAAFSPDTKRVATGSQGNEAIKVWDVESRELVLNLEGHLSIFDSIGFSPDGNILAASNWRGVLHLWPAPSWAEIEAAEHVKAEGGIDRWLILAPIALKAGQSGAEGLDIEQMKGEAQLRPTAGKPLFSARGKPSWREVTLAEDRVIDFNALVGHETPQSVAYAVCYIRSETEQRGLQMLVGSDDQSKIYLNGKEAYKSLVARPFAADEDTVPDITLNAGLNVLVFKVVNEMFGWQGSIRFTDAQGNPVKGINVTLTP